ncbi:hypothetical protein EVG20_g2402 [Dentipellis fragilis]|uniref:Uncharacterized protein n=1 Tax=Dentipellis fragilis TaxID=205917 RepID=A0A4Y9Z6X8_9AGAM|nr:hypothetical protein EVG20_g2402 [Dentipellis fragilis]
MAAAQTQSHAPYSLVDDLTRGTDEYPATELATELLRLAARDVSSFQRNSQIAYRTVSASRDIRNKINELIKDVETTNDWGTWDKYSAAIDPLEQILYKIINITYDESSQYLPHTTSVDECLTDVTKWKKNRKDLRDIFGSLFTDTELKVRAVSLASDAPADKDIASKHDDTSLLSAIYLHFSSIFEGNFTKETKAKKLLNTIKDSLGNVRTKLKTAAYNPEFFELGVASGMLVYGALGIATNKTVQKSWKQHLVSSEVWNSAKSLLEEIDAVIGTGNLTLSGVQTKYNAFEALLKKLPGLKLPENYNELPKQGGKVRRPYRERAYAFMAICRVLANKFNETADRTYDHLDPLENAIADTLVALKAAADAVVNLQSIDVTKIESDNVNDAFVAAKTKIEECFKKLNMESAWSTEYQKLTAAVEKDKKRVEEWNTYLGGKHERVETKTAAVTVTLTICTHTGGQTANGQGGSKACIHGGGSVLRTSTHNITSTDRLSALLWKERQDHPDQATQLDQNAVFEKAKDQPLATDSLISSVVENGKASLYLMLTA